MNGGGTVLGLAACALALSCGCGGDRKAGDPSAIARPARPSRLTLALPVTGGTRDVTLELAITNAERNQGLMNRTRLEPDAGMLFVFREDRMQKFWMKNTLIPLDILFLEADGTIVNIAKAQPAVEAPGYFSVRPARMVLELNQGWCEQHGLQPGAKVPVPPEILALPQD